MLLRRLVFTALICMPLAALCQTKDYVSDDIPITLRSGPSLQNKIVRMLSAGDEVEVLSADKDSGWSQVRLPSDGTEGWLLTRYLTAQPIARDLLAAANKSVADAQSQVKDLKAQVATLTDRLAQAQQQLDTTASKNHDISSQLQDIRTASANAIQLRDQNENLKQRMADSEQSINRLTMEKRELESENRQQWFIVGAAVLFGGILIGLIAPHTKRKRRSSW
ncbi:MAG TPA: TIGR04211 family SH3 domain-containing protein [Gammaproteobacteria bacterium]|nr:TIGR04211 family SH3 domain-containing protein [Gammaproteobacteria bacterium]